MTNRIILIGRMVADPELRYTQSGIAMVSYRIAVDRNYKSASGEKLTDFINIVSWRKQAEFVNQYYKKGRLIVVEGSLQMRKYQTKEGENRTIYEVAADTVRALDRGDRSESPVAHDNSSAYPSDHDMPPTTYEEAPGGTAMPGAEPEDDLPF